MKPRLSIFFANTNISIIILHKNVCHIVSQLLYNHPLLPSPFEEDILVFVRLRNSNYLSHFTGLSVTFDEAFLHIKRKKIINKLGKDREATLNGNKLKL